MVDGSSEQPEKKIIVDEDWKSQVEREREEARKKQASTATDDTVTSATPAESSPDSLPPASFEQVVSMLASSAMVFLGEIPDPNRDEPVIDLPVAKHYIDLLEVLGKKTQGNLTPEENAMLQTVTYQLRMAFVARRDA